MVTFKSLVGTSFYCLGCILRVGRFLEALYGTMVQCVKHRLLVIQTTKKDTKKLQKTAICAKHKEHVRVS